MSWRKKLDPNKRLDWGHYEMTKEDREAMYWCHANGIVIHEEIKKDGPWHIFIKKGRNVHRSPKMYGRDEVIEKVFEFYKYYYNKEVGRK